MARTLRMMLSHWMICFLALCIRSLSITFPLLGDRSLISEIYEFCVSVKWVCGMVVFWFLRHRDGHLCYGCLLSLSWYCLHKPQFQIVLWSFTPWLRHCRKYLPHQPQLEIVYHTIVQRRILDLARWEWTSIPMYMIWTGSTSHLPSGRSTVTDFSSLLEFRAPQLLALADICVESNNWRKGTLSDETTSCNQSETPLFHSLHLWWHRYLWGWGEYYRPEGKGATNPV